MVIMRYSEWEVNLIKDSRPEEVVIEVTTECNYSCIHCFRSTMFDECLGRMNLGLFRKLVNELGEVGVKKVVFSGWGEPLTHPMIVGMIKEVKDLGIYVVLNTNGSLLAKYANDIYNVGVDEIVVSVDSIETDLYRSIRSGGILSKVIEGILTVDNLRGYKGTPKLSMLFTINSLNIDDVINVPTFARKLGIGRVIFSHIIPLSKMHEKKMAVYVNESLVSRLSKTFSELSKEVLSVGGSISLPNNRVIASRSCPFMINKALFVRWDGHVAPCINYSHNWINSFFGVERIVYAVKFGNILNERLIDIWVKPEYLRFRARTTFFTQPSCLDCNLAPYCTYTSSNLYDCLGNTPTCAHCPYSHDLVRCPL